MRVLHAIHDFLPRHQAGSEIYAFDLSRAQRRLGLETHVLCADYDLSLEHGTLRQRVHEGVGVTELINNWAFSSFRETYSSPFLNQQLRQALTALVPDVLHIHNLLNLSFDLPATARQFGIPTVATLHDYTLVCPSGGQRVHQADAHICTIIDTARCQRCFTQHNFHGRLAFGQLPLRRLSRAGRLLRIAGAVRRRAPEIFSALTQAIQGPALGRALVSVEQIEERLDAVRRVFEAVDLFLAPSPNLAAEYRRLGIPPEKLRTSDYGFVRFEAPPRSARPERLRIGFVGTLVWHKGVHVLLEAVRALPANRFEVKVFGDPHTSPEYTAMLRAQARGLPVRFMGRFEREHVRDVYSSIDVLVVASLWPENSPLVIHEAFMAGIPVVGSRQGGIQDLIVHDTNGLLYEAFSPTALASALRSLVDEPARLERLAAAVPAVKSIDDDAAELRSIYEELLRNRVREGSDTSARTARGSS